MELYKKSDIKLIDENIDKIVEDIENVRKQLFPRPRDKVATSEEESQSDTKETLSDSEPQSDSDSVTTTPTKTEKKAPSLDDVKEIVQIVLNFVKEKKRKVYGGFGLNSVIKFKNKNDAFYSENEVPDIDIYSSSPIEDLLELCDTLHAKGYTDVYGTEAFHQETYKIFTKGYGAIDISYVPKMIYDNIPFVEIDGIRYVHPSFAMMDFFRMLSEPLFSSWRWRKVFVRLQLIQKYYPIQKMPQDVKVLNVYRHKKNISDAFSVVEKFILNNDTIYLFGDFVHNKYVDETKMQSISKVDIGIYQIVSTDYKNDAIKLIKELEKNGLKITFNEFYPFWSLTDYNIEILCDGEVIVKMYDNLKRCCPTQKVKHNGGIVQIGSFDYILLMEMVLGFRQKVLNDQDRKKYHSMMISNILQMREYYFKQNKKTLLDKTLFESFISSCTGETIDPIMHMIQEKQERKKNKQPYNKFSYRPVRKLKTKWTFLNTSGNQINNPKNLKIKKKSN